jgi:hypothetical protein
MKDKMSHHYFVETNKVRISDLKPILQKGLKLSIQESRYPGGKKYTISLKNTGTEKVTIDKVGAVFTTPKIRKNREWRVFLDQGGCGWCGVKRLESLEPDPHLQPVRDQRFSDSGPEPLPFHRSDLQTVIWDAAGRQTFLVGFLGQHYGYNKIDIIPNKTAKDIDRIEAWQMFEIELSPGTEQKLDPVVIAEGDDPYEILERFGDEVRAHYGRRFDDPPVVGMMTWCGYRTAVDENIVLGNADILGDFFGGYPQKMQNIMLIDNGWQEDANWGFWQPDQKRFPHGMKWLSRQLKARGMSLGLWYTPFCITDNAPNYRQLLPFQALDEKGKPEGGTCCVWGDLPGHPTERTAIFLDGGKEAVQEKWFRELSEMKRWGCVYWKLDFFALLTGHANRSRLGTGDLYAKTWRNFRKAVGSDGHLAPCSCGTNIQVGYNDSIRIGSDIGEAGSWPGAMRDYRYGLSTTAALWYKHRTFWVNDSDSIQIAKGCSLSEARVRATMVAMSGGHLMLGEDLRRVDPERIEIVRRLIPPYPRAARPLDLFNHPFPEGYPAFWSLTLDTEFGPRSVLAVFNLTEKTKTYTITPEMLGIRPGKEFLALEWWQYRWLGRFDRPFSIDVPPEDVAVIHARPTQHVPSLLSISHHVTGGYILENIAFDPATGKLSGIIAAKAGVPMVLFGHLPKGWSLATRTGFHASASSVGGWQSEIVTDAQHTKFTVQFRKTKK